MVINTSKNYEGENDINFGYSGINFDYAFSGNKHHSIVKLMQLIQIHSTMNKMVEQSISYYNQQNPGVSQQVWIDIKQNIDYVTYIKKVEQIFDANYSQKEIKYLILIAKSNPNKMPLFKQIVQQQLYLAGKEFGKGYSNLIKRALNQKGY